jgi:2-oxoglutarate ferredoxin oxidoreductase subunit gamma
MSNRYEMRFGGTGGQGLMLLGDVLALAAGVYDGKEIVLTKSYGPEARGSACRSELIIDDSAISYPVVSRPNFLLALSQVACDKYSGDLAENGLLLVDSGLVNNIPKEIKAVCALPITQISIDTCGSAISANMVALGAIAVLCDRLDEKTVFEAMCEQLPEKIIEINKKAFAAGVEAARKI